MRINIILLLFIIVSCGGEKKNNVQEDTSVESLVDNPHLKIDTLVLSVEGMTCTGCEKTVETSLLALPGVKAVKASHIDKTASIEFEEGSLEAGQAVKAIRKVGYKATE